MDIPIGYLLEEEVDDFIRWLDDGRAISFDELCEDLDSRGIPWDLLPYYLCERILEQLIIV